jgi:hypothetical protein
VSPLHLGSLHPIETILVFVLAFGPFVGLVAVVVITRRRTEGSDRDPAADEGHQG